MDIREGSVAQAKKALVRMAKQRKTSITGRELVLELAPQIHARLQDGHGLKAIWFTIVTDMPEGERMTFPTFKRYWQSGRQELGLSPLKSRTVPTMPTAKYLDPAPHPVTQPKVKGGTGCDFRIDPENI